MVRSTSPSASSTSSSANGWSVIRTVSGPASSVWVAAPAAGAASASTAMTMTRALTSAIFAHPVAFRAGCPPAAQGVEA